MNIDFVCNIRFDTQEDMTRNVDKIANDYEGHIPFRIAYNFPIKYATNFIQNGKLFNTEISIKHEYCICYVNKRDVPHEILHAIYFKHEKYRHLVKTLYENLENNLKIYKILNELRYPDNVIIDEFQAYLFSETNPWTFFKIKSLDKQSIKYYQKCVQFLSNIGYKTQNKSKPKL
tara:strand:- start:2308 stop:2832 length:525 start_codon:yes stop_codon:yes gene_type:complete